jgi:hypothetical protein
MSSSSALESPTIWWTIYGRLLPPNKKLLSGRGGSLLDRVRQALSAGQNIRFLPAEIGLIQVEIAELVGLTASDVSRIINARKGVHPSKTKKFIKGLARNRSPGK